MIVASEKSFVSAWMERWRSAVSVVIGRCYVINREKVEV